MEMFTKTIFCCGFERCGNEYTSKYNLQRHIKINHLKEKQGKCKICGRVFVSTDNLKEHKYIHMNVKPFACGICGMRYRNKCMLIRHRRSHLFDSGFDN